MSFLDSKFDLSSTQFDSQKLDFARKYWTSIINIVDPKWLKNPSGQLGVNWRSENITSAVRLIHIAYFLYKIGIQIDPKIRPIFENKIKQLLYHEGIQFKELLSEFSVGFYLVDQHNLRVNLEPSSANSDSGKNVDYSLKLENGITVYVESTVFHVERLHQWKTAVTDLANRFRRKIEQKNLNRELTITAPLELTTKNVPIKSFKQALEHIVTNKSGKYKIKVDEETLILEWIFPPHFDEYPEGGWDGISGNFFSVGKGARPENLSVVNTQIKWSDDSEKIIYSSLENTLDNKRKQFRLDEPYLLMIRNFQEILPREYLAGLFLERIFNNNKYAWLSKVGIYTTRFGQNTGYKFNCYFMENFNSKKNIPKTF